jgi:hypothetical protein
MIDNDLAAAVHTVVANWLQETPLPLQLEQLASPAGLSAELGTAIVGALLATGGQAEVIRHTVASSPYTHLPHAFDPSDLPYTPTGFIPVPDSPGTIAGRAAALAVHGFLHLETVAYGSENGGGLFVNLVALPGAGALPEKSKKSMRGHTDGVSFPLNGEDDPTDPRIAPSPDFVTLVGLRNVQAVPTRVMPVTAMLAQLDASQIDELKKPQYSMRSQRTFVQGMKAILGGEHVAVDQPVLKEVGDAIYVRYSHSSVVASEPGGAAEAASTALEQACNQSAVGVNVQPGDLLLLNNRLALHGRGEVGHEVGGQSRWLLRAYALDTETLAPKKRHPGDGQAHVLFP